MAVIEPQSTTLCKRGEYTYVAGSGLKTTIYKPLFPPLPRKIDCDSLGLTLFVKLIC